MATFFTDETLQLNSGTVTAWLPLTTPWISIAACSSEIYQQRAGLGGNFIAFDPLYGESIVPSAIPCLPPQVTSSWFQAVNSLTTTVLGPTFVCPAAYSAVETILINSLTQQILCCPSEYTLNIPITGNGHFPSQCTSLLSSGQTLTYESTTPSGPWGIATTVVAAPTAASTGPTIVYAQHVNGFNAMVASSTISSPSPSETTSIIPSSSTAALASRTSSLSVPSSMNNSTSLSNGAVAGISVGAVLVFIVTIIAVWFVFRRARMNRKKQTHVLVMTSEGIQGQKISTMVPEGRPGPHEVDGGSLVHTRVHEMYAA